MTKQELVTQINEAERKAQVYKGCKDGSYEMALDSYGYYTAKSKLNQLEGESYDNGTN